MTYTLWRDGEHLGDVALELPARDPASVAGVFLPAAAFADLSPVMQVHVDLGAAQPVLEFPLVHEHSSGPAAIRSLSAAQAGGLPAERWLELRDERGQSVPWRLITLDRLPRAPNGQEDPMEVACRAAGIEGAGWYVHAVLRPPLVAA
jgi:hypothetical protein